MNRPSYHEPSLYSGDGYRKYLSPLERTRFIRVAIEWDRVLVGTLCPVLAHTGCRISEALALRGASFDLDEGSVAIFTLKRRGRVVVREVPLPRELCERLSDLHGVGRSGLDRNRKLFPWSRGRAWGLVKAVILAANIPPRPHATANGLRHAYGIHGVRTGVPVTFLKKWLGHARLSTTEIYLEAMGPEEREIASRMWNAEGR